MVIGAIWFFATYTAMLYGLPKNKKDYASHITGQVLTVLFVVSLAGATLPMKYSYSCFFDPSSRHCQYVDLFLLKLNMLVILMSVIAFIFHIENRWKLQEISNNKNREIDIQKEVILSS